MVKEVVRTDSLKGRRGRLPSKPKSPQETPPSPPVSLITALVRAHVDTSPDLPNLDYSKFQVISPEEIRTNGREAELIQQFYDVMMGSLEIIRTWAEKVPGFLEMCREDRDLLLQSASMELFALRIAYRMQENSESVVFCNGLVLHRSQCIAGFGEWIDSIIEFGQHLQRMTVDLSSLSCMAALTMITQRHGLQEPAKMEETQMKIIESLRDHCTYNSDAMKKQNFFSRILGVIPDLRTLSREGVQRLRKLQDDSLITAPAALENLYLKSQLPF